MKKLRLTIAALVSFLLLGQLSAFAGSQDFILNNNTGATIYRVYVSPHNTSRWQKDVLGESTLVDGGRVRIHFSPRERAAMWDIKVVDRAGNYLTWYSLNLIQIERITLYYNYDTGRGTADIDSI
jgi:hypothetical protein